MHLQDLNTAIQQAVATMTQLRVETWEAATLHVLDALETGSDVPVLNQEFDLRSARPWPLGGEGAPVSIGPPRPPRSRPRPV